MNNIKRNLRSILIAGIAVGLILRFVSLGKQSLWVDEMLTLVNAYIPGKLGYQEIFSNLQGPAISGMMHFWGKLSMGESFLRLPFAVIGSLGFIACYRLARVLQGSREAVHTAFLVSLSPILIWYSQEIRGYAPVVLLTAMMSYFLLKWTHHPSRTGLFYYGVCFLGALLSNLTAIFISFSHFLFMLTSTGRRRLIGRWLVTVFAVVLLFSPWIREIMVRVQPQTVISGQRSEQLKGGAEISTLIVPYSLYTLSVGYTLGPSIREIKADPINAVRRNLLVIATAGILFSIIFFAGIQDMIRVNPEGAFLLMLLLVVPFILSILLAVMNIKVFTPRYLLVSAPAYLIILGQGLSRISKSSLWGLTLPLIAIIALSLFNYYFDSSYAKDDSRSAAKQILSDLQPDDVIVGVYSTEALGHYLKGAREVNNFGLRDFSSPASIASRCKEVTEGAKRTWLFLCREEFVDPQGYIESWFESNFNLVATWRYPGVKLHLYEVRRS
ncbi:MAG: glycosyltransferase family 39 protein [bacterium]